MRGVALLHATRQALKLIFAETRSPLAAARCLHPRIHSLPSSVCPSPSVTFFPSLSLTRRRVSFIFSLLNRISFALTISSSLFLKLPLEYYSHPLYLRISPSLSLFLLASLSHLPICPDLLASFSPLSLPRRATSTPPEIQAHATRAGPGWKERPCSDFHSGPHGGR